MVEVDSSVGNIEGALETIRKESSYFQIITTDYKVVTTVQHSAFKKNLMSFCELSEIDICMSAPTSQQRSLELQHFAKIKL